MMMWLLQIQEKGQGIEWIVCVIKTCSSMSKERMGMKRSWVTCEKDDNVTVIHSNSSFLVKKKR